MSLETAENIFHRTIEEDFTLCDNMPLLRKYISSWSKTMLKEVQSVPVLLRWYKKTFLEQKNTKSKENCCILAVIIMETLLEDDSFYLVAHSSDLFSEAILPLHEMITHYQCSETSNPSNLNVEMIISLYKIHWKLSQNTQHVKYVKKYGLWKTLMHIYLKSSKFSLPIQNICTEYMNSLLITECMPDELYLLLEMITTNAKIIKDHIGASCYNDQILFRSLRLLYHILLKNFSRLNEKAFNLISRKCHLLWDTSFKIAVESKNTPIVKYALFVHILLKHYFIAGEESVNPQYRFENLLCSVGDTLIDFKFFKYTPEVFSLLKEIYLCPDFQNLWIRIQVDTLDLYSKRLSLNLNLPSDEIQENSDIVLSFYEKYRIQLLETPDLPEILDSLLKLMFNDCSYICESSKNYLIRCMNSVLKSFVHYNSWLSSDLCNLLINIIHAVCALFSQIAVSCHNFDILETLMGICRLNTQNRLDIKIAAFNLCRLIVKQQTKLPVMNLELVKQIMIDNFRNDQWEVRDCVLELLADCFSMFSEDNSNYVIGDPYFFEIFSKTLIDNESYVRASAYKVISAIVLLPLNRPLNFQSLLSQTLTQFPKETESNVRINMIMFIDCIWRNCKITSISLLKNVYETIYYAASTDLNEEVRFSGMMFWQHLVHIFIRNVKRLDLEFLEKLACIGCLQATTNALEEEYDLQVVNIAMDILNLLFSSTNSFSGSFIHVDIIETVQSTNTKQMEDLMNNCGSKQYVNIVPLIDRPSHYISGMDFLKKYNETNLEQIKNDKMVPNETLNLENLMYNFKKVTFDASVNEKDCY